MVGVHGRGGQGDGADFQAADSLNVQVLGALVKHFADEGGAGRRQEERLGVKVVTALRPAGQRKVALAAAALAEQGQELLLGVGHRTASGRRRGASLELPGQDSNLDKESQNLLCYRYTTG